MLDHLLGRPSVTWNRTQSLLLTVASLTLLLRRSSANPRTSWLPHWLTRLNDYLKRHDPWKLVLATWTIQYLWQRLFLILGLGEVEPLERMYDPGYFRATWVFTALDAGFWTAMRVQPSWLRQMASVVFTVIYLCYPQLADEKVRRIRRRVTVDHLRASWEKGKHPLIRLATRLRCPKLTVCHDLTIDRPSRLRPSQHQDLQRYPFRVRVFYTGSLSQFRQARSLVYHIPGGGFVAMDPICHEDYLSRWAQKLQVPIVSINYRKAPEFPFPYALEECFDFYRLLVETNGSCIGMRGWSPTDSDNSASPLVSPLRIILAGDSAGANLAAGVMIQTLEHPELSQPIPHLEIKRLTRPSGLLLVYGCFDFNISSWMSEGDYQRLRNLTDTPSSDWNTRNHIHHWSPLATQPGTYGRRRKARSRTISGEMVGFDPKATRRLSRNPSPTSSYASLIDHHDHSNYHYQNSTPSSTATDTDADKDHQNTTTRLTMSSRTYYFNDRILTLDLLRAMVILYIGSNRRPDFARNYYLSPVVAPDYLLAQFPPTHFICGEKDPFVDDTVVLASRIREAKRALADQLPSAPTLYNGHQSIGGDRVLKTRAVSAGVLHKAERGTTDGKAAPVDRERYQQGLSPLTPINPPSKTRPRFFTGGDDPQVLPEQATLHSQRISPVERLQQPSDPHSDSPRQAHHSHWFTLLNHTPLEQLRWLTTTPTPVHIIEGVSHAFLQMLAVYPKVERLVEHMAQSLETMLTTSDPFLQELNVSHPDRDQESHTQATHTDPQHPIVRPNRHCHSASDNLSFRRSTSALPLLTLTSDHPAGITPRMHRCLSPDDKSSTVQVNNSNNNGNNNGNGNDRLSTQGLSRTTRSSESAAVPGTIQTRFLIHRRRLDMVSALGTVPKVDIPRR
ncbi:hypothetical protein IWQ62_000233 [Dispira parvispora]|uniref:Alpha/beta hydrolase fold-3 domain-containing protein n=1 Tax=Dispira parvispora TaxID=1520584 RepID=A0A9W8EAD5_9FUNG|nr:hypothetical protein IWQ62_000233 [Dispira parvispora]